MEVDGPSSLPSNYVTILHLKERWLKQQQQQSSPTSKPTPPAIKPKPNDDSPSASKTLNDVVVPPVTTTTNPHRFNNPRKPDSVSKTHNDVVQSINKPKPDVTSSHGDSASKTHNDVVSIRKTPYRVNNKPKPDDGSASSKNPDDVIPRQAVNKIKPKPDDGSASSKTQTQTQTPNDVVSHQAINEVKPDVKTQDGSASKVANVVSRKKKPYRVKSKPEPEVGMHDSGSKTVVESVDNNDEKQEEEGDKTDELKSKQPATKKNKNGSRRRNPRSIVNQILMEQRNEHVKEKKQEERPEEVWEPKGEKESFSGNVSVNVGETVKSLAAAGVKEMNVGQRSNNRGRGGGGGGRDSRGFRGGSRNGASFGVHKGQMNMNMNNCVWVKKGETLST